MTRNPSKIYKYHVANLKELELAISQVARLTTAAIASGDPQRSLRTLNRLHAFLIGSWAETRLNKLLNEEFGFTNAERQRIESFSTQLERWTNTIDLAFRKHHNKPKAELNADNIGVAHAARRQALHDVLGKELRIIIEIRNKLAHGQWVYPLNSDNTAVEQEKYKLINNENALSLRIKYSLVGYLADATHDLVVSPTTFERDFEKHFRGLFQARKNLVARKYADYAARLVQDRQRARQAKKKVD
jgi:hypothetical protein